MKKRVTKKKLQIEKFTISRLSNMNKIKGGATAYCAGDITEEEMPDIPPQQV